MAKYRKIPVVIDAEQWLRHGDNGNVNRVPVEVWNLKMPGPHGCKSCACHMADHGWCGTLEGGHIVCPGDWMITGIEGELYPCKPRIFHKTYEAV